MLFDFAAPDLANLMLHEGDLILFDPEHVGRR
jgi:hypothetical protein